MNSNDKFEYFGWGEDCTMKYKQPKPNTNSPGEQKDVGYPQTGVKSDGIEVRGCGAATKGRKARGPMA